MAPRTISGSAEQWQRVADAVVARREELKLTAAEVAADGVSTSVLSLIENNKQTKYSTRTVAALCDAMSWTADSVRRLLDGLDPLTLEDAYLDDGLTWVAGRASLRDDPRKVRDGRMDPRQQHVIALSARIKNHEQRLEAIEAALGIVPPVRVTHDRFGIIESAFSDTDHLTNEQFTQAAHKGFSEVENESDQMSKPVAGFDPDED